MSVCPVPRPSGLVLLEQKATEQIHADTKEPNLRLGALVAGLHYLVHHGVVPGRVVVLVTIDGPHLGVFVRDRERESECACVCVYFLVVPELRTRSPPR